MDMPSFFASTKVCAMGSGSPPRRHDKERCVEPRSSIFVAVISTLWWLSHWLSSTFWSCGKRHLGRIRYVPVDLLPGVREGHCVGEPSGIIICFCSRIRLRLKYGGLALCAAHSSFFGPCTRRIVPSGVPPRMHVPASFVLILLVPARDPVSRACRNWWGCAVAMNTLT